VWGGIKETIKRKKRGAKAVQKNANTKASRGTGRDVSKGTTMSPEDRNGPPQLATRGPRGKRNRPSLNCNFPACKLESEVPDGASREELASTAHGRRAGQNEREEGERKLPAQLKQPRARTPFTEKPKNQGKRRTRRKTAVGRREKLRRACWDDKPAAGTDVCRRVMA